MQIYGHHLKESMHREVQIKHDLMSRKCKYTWWPKTQNKLFVWENEQYL